MINIVCALECEARPIINHFGLRHKPVEGLKLYQNSNIKLVISGVGKEFCLSTINLLAQYNKQSSPWLNIGIAGHGRLAIGEGRLIHKITGTDGLNWFPPRLNLKSDIKLNKNDIGSISLITVDTPEQNYLENCAYDMEGAYFYQVAIKHQVSKLVQCYKIISDNNFSSTENINAKKVSVLVRNKLPEISIIIDKLSKKYVSDDLNLPCT